MGFAGANRTGWGRQPASAIFIWRHAETLARVRCGPGTVSGRWPAEAWRSAALRAAIAITAAAMLLGCGTDVKQLLAHDSQASWQAFAAIEQSERLELGFETAVYEAESRKAEACRPIYAAAVDQFSLKVATFWQDLWSGLVQLVARVVPIEVVENCAEAHERFRHEIATLRDLLEAYRPPNRQEVTVQ